MNCHWVCKILLFDIIGVYIYILLPLLLSSLLSLLFLLLGDGPLPVTVTTRITTCLVLDPFKPSFTTATGKRPHPNYCVCSLIFPLVKFLRSTLTKLNVNHTGKNITTRVWGDMSFASCFFSGVDDWFCGRPYARLDMVGRYLWKSWLKKSFRNYERNE